MPITTYRKAGVDRNGLTRIRDDRLEQDLRTSWFTRDMARRADALSARLLRDPSIVRDMLCLDNDGRLSHAISSHVGIDEVDMAYDVLSRSRRWLTSSFADEDELCRAVVYALTARVPDDRHLSVLESMVMHDALYADDEPRDVACIVPVVSGPFAKQLGVPSSYVAYNFSHRRERSGGEHLHRLVTNSLRVVMHAGPDVEGDFPFSIKTIYPDATGTCHGPARGLSRVFEDDGYDVGGLIDEIGDRYHLSNRVCDRLLSRARSDVVACEEIGPSVEFAS